MTTDREAFIAAIAANPADDLPRLVFADWLDEHGVPERAQFIRTQFAYTTPGQSHSDLYRLSYVITDAINTAGKSWAQALFRLLGVEVNDHRVASGNWLSPGTDGELRWSYVGPETKLALIPDADGNRAVVTVTYERGFVSRVHLPPLSSLVRPALANAFRFEPITSLIIDIDADATADHWTKLTDPSLGHMRELVVRIAPHRNWSPLPAMLADPHLAGVRKFTLELDPYSIGSVTLTRDLHQFVGSPLAHQLTSLRLMELNSDEMQAVCDSALLRLDELEATGEEVHRCAAILARSPTASSVRRLLLCGYDFDDTAVAQLAQGLWPRLTELVLGGNGLSDAGLGHLADAPFVDRLETLDLLESWITSEDQLGLRALAAVLNPDRLRRLNLSNCGLSEVPAFLAARFGDRVTV